MIHGSMIAASNQIEQALKEARDAGQFMSVVWFVDGKGALQCRRTTWQFPMGKMVEAEGLLSKMINDELNPVKAPLPLAAFLAPRPVEQDETVSDPLPPPIVNAVIPLDSEDGE